MTSPTFWLRLICLALLSCGPANLSAAALPVAYFCQTGVEFAQVPSHERWLRAADGKVPGEPANSPCWVRIEQLPQGQDGQLLWLSFSELHVQRATLSLFDANGTLLGQARRLGPSRQALVSGRRATFIPHTPLQLPLYVRIDLAKGLGPIPGLPHRLQVEAIEPATVTQAEQRSDLFNLSIAALLAATALLAAGFGLALRDLNYGIYSLYASAQTLTVFAKSGLPFAFDQGALLWLDIWSFQCLVSLLSVWFNVRFGHFRRHSPRTTNLAGAIALSFALLIPLNHLAPSWAATATFALLPLHFAALLSGNWRGWRQGERSCGILLFGMLPITLYWLTFFTYNALLHQPMPSALAIGSSFDVIRTLALPAAFCYGLAEQTLRLQQETARQARFDPLTRLHNREGIRQHGQSLIDSGKQPCALMLNIERFKAINETLGIELGDQILIETGRRLRALAKHYPGARVGRVHADQFCVLYPKNEALEQLRGQIGKAFNRPTEVAGQVVDIALAGGIARPQHNRQNMAHLLRNAEIALDAARSQRKTWVEYQPALESSQLADLGLLSELKRAVEEHELRLYLQPKVRLHDGAVLSAEALVRWHHPRRGVIPPGDFVPFAEKTGRITLLTHWMLNAAMRLTTLWREQQRPLQISVNLSAFDLADSSFVSHLERMLKHNEANPADIRLEVTESAAMQDPDAALTVMQQLHEAGFSLSIDDFGTGYSSLAYLQKMPAEELKIDRSFIHAVTPDSEGAALLESTISLGHRLGLSLVGEGAETAEEWQLLLALGCDYAQGWHAAKPMPIDEFETWRLANSPFIAQPKRDPPPS